MFKLIYTHKDFYLINKAPGVSVHRDDNEVGLMDELKKELGDPQLFLIHRLDKMTSGLLLIGRSQEATSILSGLFASRNIKKIYLALTDRKPKKKQGKIVGDMVRSRRSTWKLTQSKENPAITLVKSISLRPGYRLFSCELKTGKTHQIRVALKSLGAPILGDITYAGTPSDRGYLHAYYLNFIYRDEEFIFTCMPDCGEHWQLTEEQLAGLDLC